MKEKGKIDILVFKLQIKVKDNSHLEIVNISLFSVTL